MKLLIAEDDFTSCTMLTGILTKWGYEVMSTGDGNEAFSKFQADDAPQLAVLDWEMPGMDGATLCRALRRQGRRTPLYLILLTSRGNSGDIVQGLDAGADDYITKPYDHAELRARIDVGVRMVKLQNQMQERERLEGVLEMAGAVCHELNQPLQCVTGYSEMLLLELNSQDPNYEMLHTIKAGIDHIAELTRKIMKITRYQSKPYLKRQIIDIEEASRSEQAALEGVTESSILQLPGKVGRRSADSIIQEKTFFLTSGLRNHGKDSDH